MPQSKTEIDRANAHHSTGTTRKTNPNPSSSTLADTQAELHKLLKTRPQPEKMASFLQPRRPPHGAYPLNCGGLTPGSSNGTL